MAKEDKKRVVSNIFYLALLQGANYLLPLVSVPYLVRVLGPDRFGLVSYAIATIAYFSLISEYGFSLSATRQIAIHRNNNEKINEIFSAIMIAKLVLMAVSFSLLCILVFTVDRFRSDWGIYLVTYGVVVGNALFPQWFFQGMESMKYVTKINLGAKLFFTLLIFVFVRNDEDYLVVPLLNALGYIAAGIWSLVLIRGEFNVTFVNPGIRGVVWQMVDGWTLFISNLGVSLYTISSTFVLGMFANNHAVGLYAGVEKIISAVKGVYGPILQALYPYLSKRLDQDRCLATKLIYKEAIVVGGLMLFVSGSLFVYSDDIVRIALGRDYQESVRLLQIMSILPVAIPLSNIFGIHGLINMGAKKDFTWVVVTAGLLSVALTLAIVPVYREFGSAIAITVIEIFVSICMMILFYKRSGRRRKVLA